MFTSSDEECLTLETLWKYKTVVVACSLLFVENIFNHCRWEGVVVWTLALTRQSDKETERKRKREKQKEGHI